MHRLVPLATLSALAALAAGCGSNPDARFALKTPPTHRGAVAIHIKAPPPVSHTQRKPTQRDAERLRPLIAGWATALREGNAERAARYFALPAIVAQSDTIQLVTHADALAFNEGLPCGARLLEVQHEGRYIVGTFRLTAKPRQSCLTPGQLVRVAFVIQRRHFTEWRQVPDTPGAKPGPSKPEDLKTLPRPGGDGPETA
jgi:hypothetical protein